MATSLPAWPGWKAELAGTRIPALPYNHAFLALRVPAGSHRLELRYAPDGFRYGAAVSVSTLAIAAAILFRSRRKKPGPNPS